MEKTKKVLDVIEAEVNKILEKEAEAINQAEKQLTTAESKKAEIEKEIAEAYESGNAERYGNLKKKTEELANTISVYKHLAADLKEKPCITQEEYQVYLKKVKAAFNESVTEAERLYINCVDSFIKAYAGLKKDVDQANKILHALQYDVFKDCACMILGNGQKVHIHTLEESVTKHHIAIMGIMDSAINNGAVPLMRSRVNEHNN